MRKCESGGHARQMKGSFYRNGFGSGATRRLRGAQMRKIQIVEQWSLSGVRRYRILPSGKLLLLDEAPNLLGFLPWAKLKDLLPEMMSAVDAGTRE
jgi:hypothetical protein